VWAQAYKASTQNSKIVPDFTIKLVFLCSVWVATGIESILIREHRRARKKPVMAAKNPATIPMPAAPAGQTGWPQHGQADVLMKGP
jgi:hypothetical protein